MFRKGLTTVCIILILVLAVGGCSSGNTEKPSDTNTTDAALVKENKALSDANTELKKSNKTLSENNTILAEANKALSDANTELKKSNKTLSENNTALTKENKTLEETVKKQSAKISYEEAKRIMASFKFQSGGEDSINSRIMMNLQFLEVINRLYTAHAVPALLMLSDNKVHIIIVIPVADRNDPVYVDLAPKDGSFVPKEVTVEIGKPYFKENGMGISPAFIVLFFKVIQ